MLSPQALLKVIISNLLPGFNADNPNQDAPLRGDSYGGLFTNSIVPTKHLLAAEGTYFTANNAQTGQATAATAPLAFTATTPAFIIFNNAPSASQIKIYLDYVLWAVSVAPTATTSVQLAVVRDLGNRFSALGTGGAALTPAKTNSAGKGSNALVWSGGQLVATAATSAAVTLVGNRILRGTIPIINDVYVGQFGSVDGVVAGVAAAAVASHILEPLPAAVANPGESLLVYLWYPAMSAAQTNLPEIGWWER